MFWQFQMHLIPVYLLLYILLGVIVYSNYWIGIQALIKSELLSERSIVAIPAENISVYARLNKQEIQSHVS